MRTLLIALGAVLIAWVLGVLVLYLAGRRWLAREIARLLPNVIGMFRGLVRDRRVSRIDKALLLLALAWFASPIDLIPEFIPVLGPLDDVVIGVLVLRRIVRRAGGPIASEHWKGDPATLDRLLRLARVAT